jgi:hypothetical protein
MEFRQLWPRDDKIWPDAQAGGRDVPRGNGRERKPAVLSGTRARQLRPNEKFTFVLKVKITVLYSRKRLVPREAFFIQVQQYLGIHHEAHNS